MGMGKRWRDLLRKQSHYRCCLHDEEQPWQQRHHRYSPLVSKDLLEQRRPEVHDRSSRVVPPFQGGEWIERDQGERRTSKQIWRREL